MIRSTPPSLSCTKAVAASYDLRRGVQGLALQPSQRYAAVGCQAELKIVKIDPTSGLISEVCLFSHNSPNAQIIDVVWSSCDISRVAVAYSTGEAKSFVFMEKASSKSSNSNTQHLLVEWTSERNSSIINKLTWHPTEANTLASAHQDGSVKLFEARNGASGKAVKVFRLKGMTMPARDVKFNPFHPDIFAEVSDNGSLKIWDRKNPDKPVMSTLAHKGKVLSVAWNPNSEWIVATGATDRAIKVWDTGSCDVSQGSSSGEMKSPGQDVEPLLLHTVNTPTEVGKLLWGSAEDQSMYIATISSASQASTDSNGFIFIWDLEKPNIPVCVLKGHSGEMCTAFEWIEYTPVADPASRGTSSGKNKKVVKPRAADASTNAKAVLAKQVMSLPSRCLLSGARDGRLLIQNPQFGYFPYNHISPCVTSISSQGHCAFHRGEIKRVKELFSQKDKSKAEADGRNRFPSSFSGSDLHALSMESPETEEKQDSLSALHTGSVFIGLADFKNLEEAKDIRVERGGAEASVFDPALIFLLARNYSLAHSPSFKNTIPVNKHVPTRPLSRSPSRNDLFSALDVAADTYSVSDVSVESTRKAELMEDETTLERYITYQSTMVACKNNFDVASAAGLKCRASVWASMMALIPAPTSASDENMDCSYEELSFAMPILAALLLELLEGGDSQHFVVVCEILRRVGILQTVLEEANISIQRSRRTYLAYIDLLTKLQLFCEANELIKASDDEYIATISKKEVEMQIKCGNCRKDLPKQLTEEAPSTSWCGTCKKCAVHCSFCLQPVTGLLQWCPICAHGGHQSCMELWFQQSSCCPTGCGHDCSPRSFMCNDPNQGKSPKDHFQIRDGVEDSLQNRRLKLKNRRSQQLQELWNTKAL